MQKFKMLNSIFRRMVPVHRLWLSVLAAAAAVAQAQISPRTGELSPSSPYVTVNLSHVANDSLAIPFPSERVEVRRIPFDLLSGGGATHLFLKPIGWSAWADERGEYPGYLAKYDSLTMNTNNPARAIVRVPVADYTAAWLLATADSDSALTNRVTLRLGVIDGPARVVYHDIVATVPRSDAKRPEGVAATIPTPSGNLYLVRAPIAISLAQDFKERQWLDLDITKELRTAINLPDPNRFQLRPLGLPSGVRIFGLTLERTPFRMEVAGVEPGNVFTEPQTPAFRIDLWSLDCGGGTYTIEAVATCDTGAIMTNVLAEPYVVASWNRSSPLERRLVEIPVKERGRYELALNVYNAGKMLVTRRRTTFAVLAPDTRQYRDASPFGTWDFNGTHLTPRDIGLRGPLAVKAGLRYLSHAPQYGLKNFGAPQVTRPHVLQGLIRRKNEDPGFVSPDRLLVFHEHGISGSHVTRTPDLFTGRPPYKLNADEKRAFTSLWEQAEVGFRGARTAFPDAEIYFGNTAPHVVEEFLRHKFPRALIDKVGNESGSFMRPPEAQPLDFVANNAGLWMFRKILDGYGYGDVGLRQCFEMCYPGSGPGNLTERTQAAYIVRHMMHSLAWRIPAIIPMSLTDMGTTYYFSNWGAAGLCRAWPDVSPKQAYVAFATMTRMLDGAEFVRPVPLPSTAVYAVEFRRKDKCVVTCFWTPRGTRPVTAQMAGTRRSTLTDLMGRESAIDFRDGRAELAISREPCYLVTKAPIEAVTLGAPRHADGPGTNAFRIASLGRWSDWTVAPGRNAELETYNFMNPRRKGNFEYREAASFEGESNVLEVKPKLPCEGSPYLQMYSVLAHARGVEIPGRPTEIGVWVNGNGGWGRVIFELEDASGQRWISIGAEQAGTPNQWMADWLSPEEFAKLKQNSMNVSDWNSDDAWGCSSINHEGWRFVSMPLPGQYPGEGYHWPRNSQWRFSGDGVVAYPLTFKKLIVTMPEKVLYLTEYVRPPRYEIFLKDVFATYAPVEQVFAWEQENASE